MNIWDFLERFGDDRACLDHIVAARLGNPTICPKCGAPGSMVHTAKPKRYRCTVCQKEYMPTAGNLLHHSRIPVHLWFYAILLFATARKGVSAVFLMKHLGIGRVSSWRMGFCIRQHLTALETCNVVPFTTPGSVVSIDETLLTNLHQNDSKESACAIVFGITDGSRVIAVVVPDRTRRTLIPLIERYVSRDVLVVTDSLATYACLSDLGYMHQVVKHTKGLWKNDDGYSTAPIEVFWAAFKRFLRQSHRKVMVGYLPFYLGEFLFRYNRRHAPGNAMEAAIGSFPDIRPLPEPLPSDAGEDE